VQVFPILGKQIMKIKTMIMVASISMVGVMAFALNPNLPNTAMQKMNFVMKMLDKAWIKTHAMETSINKDLIPKAKGKNWVEGKSLQECLGKSKVINNDTIKCREGYYQNVE
jgi:hypothetical protein